MAILIAGRIFGLICLLIIMLSVVYYIQRAKAGAVPKVRRVAGVDAIDEAIGRAVETGRPVYCSHGIGNMRDATYGPQTIAGLSVLGYVAKKCADVGARIVVPCRQPEVWPVAADIVETSYKMSGNPDAFNIDDIKFLSPDQFGYASNYLGLMMRDKPGAHIMVGAYWAESLQLAETGNRIGAIQISGTGNQHQLAFFVVATDYCLIGEEIYAAGAYMTGEIALLSSIAGQDVGRILGVALMVIGTILITFGSNAITQLIGW